MCILPCCIFAKSFESDWKRGFGGSDSDLAMELLLIDDYIYIFISSNSTDADGIKNNGSSDVYIVKYDKNGNVVSIKPIANKGYEFDKIIIKNSKNEDVKISDLKDGTYSFELNDDVSLEILFKEEIVNPKTGVIDFITIIVGFVVSFIGFTLVKKNCYRYEL